MKRLAIIGAGDLGQLIAHHAPACGYQVVGFFDDFNPVGKSIQGHPILGKLSEAKDYFERKVFDELMCGIGYKHMEFRKQIFNELSYDIPFAILIHPSAYVDKSTQIGQGCFILPGCKIDAHSVLEENVLLNTGVVLAHDSVIKSHSFCGPAAAIAGKTTIGECCFIGINSTIIDNLNLCDFAVIAAGAVVTKSIFIKGLYAGVPASKKL